MRIILNDLRTIFRIIICSFINLAVYVVGFVIRRNKKILLFGAWMGEKFADNSRFLYQYLHQNKDNYALEKVIWVTRNPKVNTFLNASGFESYLIGTRGSTYWHLKAGIHILCNISAQAGIYSPDIDVCLSAGARKVQLWHGVGIKAVGSTANATSNLKNGRSKWLVRAANTVPLRKAGYLGCWGEPKILCTSALNASINSENLKIHKENTFVSTYPRYCSCTFLLQDELDVLKKMQEYSISILYLPTFRDAESSYKMPLEGNHFISYLERNNILWIQKPHQAESRWSMNANSSCVLELSATFDVNCILRQVDIIISDYSSAAFDAAFLEKPVIMYVPDLDEFVRGGNGLLYDLRVFCPALLAFDQSEVQSMIQDTLEGKYFSDDRAETLWRIRKDFFDNRTADYEKIWNDVLAAIGS